MPVIPVPTYGGRYMRLKDEPGELAVHYGAACFLPYRKKRLSMSAGVRKQRDRRRNLQLRVVSRTHDFDARKAGKCDVFLHKRI